MYDSATGLGVKPSNVHPYLGEYANDAGVGEGGGDDG